MMEATRVRRTVSAADGTRYAVLDLTIEVPVTALPERAHIRRVLGWDWGVRTLVTATVLGLSGHRLSPPLFLDTGGFDRRQAHTRQHIDRLKKKVAKLEARRDLYWLHGTSVRKKPLLSRIEYAFAGCSWMCNKDTIRGCEQVLTRHYENQPIFLKEKRIGEPDSFLS
jgi:hypothetical protein